MSLSPTVTQEIKISHCCIKWNRVILFDLLNSWFFFVLIQLSGISDQSFGIHVAELANFPEDVIKVSRLRGTPLCLSDGFATPAREEECGGIRRLYWRSVLFVSFKKTSLYPIHWRTAKTEHSESPFPPEVIESGIAVMESFFANWSSSLGQDGDDIIMEGDASPDTQLEQLKKVVNDMRPLIESNSWLQSVITTLWVFDFPHVLFSCSRRIALYIFMLFLV